MFFLELLFGLILVLWGADLLINSAISIGKKFNLSEIFIGIIVIGFGTSLCELFVSIEAVIKGVGELTLGNIIGSNIANILLVLGISSFVKAYKFPKINAFDNIIQFYNIEHKVKLKNYKFSHGGEFVLPENKILVGCYHPSPRNVNTGRIDFKKFVSLLKSIKNKLNNE